MIALRARETEVRRRAMSVRGQHEGRRGSLFVRLRPGLEDFGTSTSIIKWYLASHAGLPARRLASIWLRDLKAPLLGSDS